MILSKSPLDLRVYAGNDEGVWSAERIRYLTKYPNWSIATLSLGTTRNYELGLSFAASILTNSFDFAGELSKEDIERAQHLTSVFFLEMLDKADRWDDYLDWFWFLRRHTNVYLRYDLHILAHRDNDIDLFIEKRGDNYTWVHNMYIHNRRRRNIERKIERRSRGSSRKSDKHSSKGELSTTELKCRLESLFSHFRLKFAAEAFWKSFWKKA